MLRRWIVPPGVAAGVFLFLAARPSAVRAQEPSAREQARQDSIRRPYTKADIDFMSGMIGHHAQAVVMANWAPSHGASPAVAMVCSRIALGQTAEIGLMQQWLGERGLSVPQADPKGLKMTMNGHEMYMTMPGMLTEAQMNQLDAARGRAFDSLFLTYMIQHHEGALIMVDTLFATPGAAQDETVFKFATNVQADQTVEIDRMQQMLDQLSADTAHD